MSCQPEPRQHLQLIFSSASAAAPHNVELARKGKEVERATKAAVVKALTNPAAAAARRALAKELREFNNTSNAL